MPIRFCIPLFVCLLGPFTHVIAQTDLPRLDLATLTLPANWQRSGPVGGGPDAPGLAPTAGTGVLVGTASVPLSLAMPATDFVLQFDLLTAVGGSASLRLPNGQLVPLGDGRVGKLPGLWQTVDLTYQAPANRRPATLTNLSLNGVMLAEGRVLAPARESNLPLAMVVQTGSVALRNIGLRSLENRAVANWAGPLTYKLYRGGAETHDDLANKTLLKTDTVRAISYDLAYGQPGRATLLFDGKLTTPTAGTYLFELHTGGVAGLWIDGKPVVPMTYHDLGDPETRAVTLAAGTHDVQVQFAKSWPRPGLGLFVSQAGTRPQPLHLAGSIPEVSPASVVAVQTETRPMLVRSFIQLPGESRKRTHALSVGNQSGLHYSLDLNQMALLQVWKGEFADVTQMWYERGEPQTLRPMGAVIRPSARPTLAVLADKNTPWPDSLDDKILIYKGLLLDKAGQPTAEYTLGGLAIRDQVNPTSPTALTRTLTVSGNVPGQLYCRLAGANVIQALGRGLYALDDRRYYIRLDPKASATIRQSSGGQELIMPVSTKSGATTVTYSLEF